MVRSDEKLTKKIVCPSCKRESEYTPTSLLTVLFVEDIKCQCGETLIQCKASSKSTGTKYIGFHEYDYDY